MGQAFSGVTKGSVGVCGRWFFTDTDGGEPASLMRHARRFVLSDRCVFYRRPDLCTNV